jgi:hypothetical protein
VAEVDMLLFSDGLGRDCERSVALCSTNSHNAGDVLKIILLSKFDQNAHACEQLFVQSGDAYIAHRQTYEYCSHVGRSRVVVMRAMNRSVLAICCW